MWNTVTSQDKRVDYYMWAKADTENGISAMARVTGSSAAIGARLVGRGKIREKGIVAPEEAIFGKLYHKFVNELAKREIRIIEALNGSNRL
jgi:saccharopine dehydrogenase-like NADP-dependent oxidoreductase